MIGSLGIITSNGIPTRITVNASDQVQAARRMGATSVRLQALPGNAGIVYVALEHAELASPMGPQLLGVIGKPASATAATFDVFEVTLADLPQGLDLYSIFVWSLSGPNSVIGSYTAN